MKISILSILLILFLTESKTQVTPNPQTDEINIAKAFPTLINETLGNIYSGYA